MSTNNADPLLRMHKDAFDLLSEAVLWVDGVGKIHGGNGSAASILGYNEADLARISYFEINPHFSLLAWKKFWRRMEGQPRERLDTEFVNARGKLFSVKGNVGFDLMATDPELIIITFWPVEQGQRERDLLEIVEQHSRVGSWEYNRSTGQVYVSPLIRDWMGWSPDRDFYAKADLREILLRAMDPQQVEAAATQLSQVSQRAQEVEYNLTLKGVGKNRAHDFYLRARSVENELEVYKVFGTIQKEEHRQSMAATVPTGDGGYRFSADRSSDAIYWIDRRNGTIAYTNQRAAEIVGYTGDALVGKSLTKLLPDTDHNWVTLGKEVARKGYVELDTELQRKDGSKLPVVFKVYSYDQGEDRYAIAVGHDTVRQQEDSENLQLHETTLNALSEWVIWLDAGNRIVLLNEAATRKLRRRTSRDLPGLNLLEEIGRAHV